MQMTRDRVIVALVFFLTWILGQWVMVHYETRFPGPDIFQFKVPGIELAQRGTLTGINLPNSPLNKRMVYAFYPPLFPVVYGIWVTCFGPGYEASIIFDSTWRLLRALIVLAFVLRIAGGHFSLKRWILVIGFVTLTTFFPNNEDRPDEMGLTFVLASIWFAISSPKLSGVFLGLAAASSPTAGVLGMITHTVWWYRDWRRWLIIVAISVLVFGAILAPVLIADSHVVERFLLGAKYNVIPYSTRSEHARMNHQGVKSFLFHLKQSILMGRATFLCLAACLGVTGILYKMKVVYQREFTVSAVLFMMFSIGVFSIEPLYLWFCCCYLLILNFAKLLQCESSKKAFMIAVILAIGMSLMAVREWKLIVDGLERSQEQRLSWVREYLRPYVESGKKLVVNADSFFSLPLGAADNTVFVCSQVHTEYDYAWVSDSLTFQKIGQRPNATQVVSLCYWKPGCYHLIGDFRSSQQFKIFGFKLPYYVRGFGGILYENRCKATGIFPPF